MPAPSRTSARVNRQSAQSFRIQAEMAPLTEIVAALDDPTVHGSLEVNDESVEVTDIVATSSTVSSGSLFCCVPGSKTDGHDFAKDAVASGAAALLVERVLDDIDASIPQIVVPSVRAAMGPAADEFFHHPTHQIDVFGVTGTNGKTTTSHLVWSMLQAAGRSSGLIGTIGARIGDVQSDVGFTTPEAIELQRLFRQMADAGNDSCAMEVSSHALDQQRTAATRFAVVGFTNLTRDHLDYHRSFEAYYLAKRKLFDAGRDGSHFPAAVNCDDEWGCRLFDELVHSDREDIPTWGYTFQDMARASVSARYLLNETGASIMVESPVGDFTLRSRLRGRFNVENVLCATTMVLLAGVTPEQIQQGLDAMEGVPGRFQPVEVGQPFDVFVDYAHTPDSLEQVLASARGICEGNLIVVFGCGGDRDKTKRPHMGRAAANAADVVVVTSDNPRSEDPETIVSEITRGIRGNSVKVHIEIDRRSAIGFAIEQAEPGDVVVIAGKGHEQGQTFADKVVPFDDLTVAREALEGLAVS